MAQSPPMPGPSAVLAQPLVMSSLFGEGYEAYRTRLSVFVVSYAANALLLAIGVWSGHWIVEHRHEIKERVTGLVTDIAPFLPPSTKEAGGGGGGGDGERVPAPKGSPPKFADEQLTPPAVVIRVENPKIAADPTVLGPPQIQLAQLGNTGDPLSAVMASISNGPGSGAGIGTGCCGGVGPGNGRGVGIGSEAGVGGGPYKPGLGVTAPRELYAPDPEYSEEARRAKFQGSVLLWMIVGSDGLPHEIKVVRSVGLGLDEKALEAVRTWRFEPGRKDGRAVATQIHVEVTFRLY
jgi:periplasmic protein TonB